MSLIVDRLGPEALPSARELLQKACAHDKASEVAEEKLFAEGAGGLCAEALGAFDGDTLVAVACTSDRWLRLLAVHPEHRGRGFGSAVLARCEDQIRRHSEIVRLLDQPGNYLAPGIDEKNTETIEWLEKRDYQAVGHNHNLIVELAGKRDEHERRLRSLEASCAERGYKVERLAADELDDCARQVKLAFSPGWAFEMRRAAAVGGVHIARHQATGELASFAAHDGNNQGLGWFGPTGTLLAHRKQSLAAALYLACLLDIADAGHQHCQVAWIGPREFYAKVAGIAGERKFTTMKKDLRP